MVYEPVIGLEVHLQLNTRTKAFCGCSTEFGAPPNTHTCPVCLGLPGSLPKLNREAFARSIKVALALRCTIQQSIKFDRKNYYYPDLPKNFQISQYDKPVAYDGSVMVAHAAGEKRIRIKRVHLEEDAGKLIHDRGPYSLVDYNRAGIPLLEIVTEPDIASPDEAHLYLTNLKAILRYLDVSDCDMEKGSLRCDANVSIRPQGSTGLGTKVELKNMNSFKNVRNALAFEIGRQCEAVSAGERIVQETRLWDADKMIATSMRSKEEAHDYRYFPEPDLVPFTEKGFAEAMAQTIPELPEARALRFRNDFGLAPAASGVLTADKDIADYFEACSAHYPDRPTIANWIMGDIMAALKEKNCAVGALGVTPEHLGRLLAMVDKGTISGKMAKEVLAEAIETKRAPDEIVQTKGLAQISDAGALETVIAAVLARNEKSVADYRAGKANALMYLVGQVMKETKGKANPGMVNDLIRKAIGAA